MPFTSLVAVLVGWILPQALASASFQLAAIQGQGIHRYTHADIAKVSGLKTGAPVSVTDLTAAAEKLAASGLFESVKYRYVTAGRQLTVTFEVVEAAWTVPVGFDNFIWFKDEDLAAAVRQDVPTFDGTSPASSGAAELITRTLQGMLKARAIPGRVDFLPQTVMNSNRISQFLFAVRDPTPKICGIRVTGAAAVTEKALSEALASSAGSDYSRFSVTSASNGTLIDMYRLLGHWRAAFGPPVVTVDAASACSGAIVTLNVSEGPAFVWDRAVWAGNAAVAAGSLDALLGMKPGEIADASKIEAGLRRVHDAYGKQGYIAQTARREPLLDDANRRAAFQIAIAEGPQFHMGSLEIIGIPDADAADLKKKWRLKPGDVYDASYPVLFYREEVNPYLMRNRAAGKRGSTEVSTDAQRQVIDLRIVFK